eukprot:scaffold22784_cov34-Tisochrysis_lutea.AAC.5
METLKRRCRLSLCPRSLYLVAKRHKKKCVGCYRARGRLTYGACRDRSRSSGGQSRPPLGGARSTPARGGSSALLPASDSSPSAFTPAAPAGRRAQRACIVRSRARPLAFSRMRDMREAPRGPPLRGLYNHSCSCG